jgi:hypothetical protein
MTRATRMSPIWPAFGRVLLLCSLAFAATVVTVGAQAAELTFDLRIDNGHLPENMRLIRVHQGDIVRLRWSADRPVTVHLHGYDIETSVEPGRVGEMRFTARATGRFPVHAHTSGDAGDAHAEAALVYLEVYPR